MKEPTKILIIAGIQIGAHIKTTNFVAKGPCNPQEFAIQQTKKRYGISEVGKVRKLFENQEQTHPYSLHLQHNYSGRRVE